MFLRLLLLFIVVPVLELILFLTLGKQIGIPLTILIILITAVLGAWLTKKEGLRALNRFQKAMGEGRLPHEEVLDGMMILVAGAVLLTPGFLTDTVGFLLLTPPVRDLLKKHFGQHLKTRIHVMSGMPMDGVPGSPPPRQRVVEAEVVEADAEVVDENPR
ncbi:MAG: FxsA family protein [Verrucomicrobiota bacterium]